MPFNNKKCTLSNENSYKCFYIISFYTVRLILFVDIQYRSYLQQMHFFWRMTLKEYKLKQLKFMMFKKTLNHSLKRLSFCLEFYSSEIQGKNLIMTFYNERLYNVYERRNNIPQHNYNQFYHYYERYLQLNIKPRKKMIGLVTNFQFKVFKNIIKSNVRRLIL